MSKPFWRKLTLDKMSPEQWESLCDGCGLCCLHKLEDMDTGDIHYTAVACHMLDLKTCRCSDYANRAQIVPDCTVLTPETARDLNWLPESCAYRRVAHGQDLPKWHPLVSGNSAAIKRAGVSASTFAIREQDADLDDLEQYIIE